MPEALASTALLDNFQRNLNEFKEASPIAKQEIQTRLLSQVDALTSSPEGIAELYGHITALEEVGIFANSPWADVGKLNPGLVHGTLIAGPPTSTMETLSELRVLKLALTSGDSSVQEHALDFIEHVIVTNLDLVFQEFSEEVRIQLGSSEIKKLSNLFNFLIDSISLEGIKGKLAEELELMTAQRPVVTRPIREIIRLIHNRLKLDKKDPIDRRLEFFINAVYSPLSEIELSGDAATFGDKLASLKPDKLEKIAKDFAVHLRGTGLGNEYHPAFLKFAANKDPKLVVLSLGLDDSGKAEYYKHQEFVNSLFGPVIDYTTAQATFGLARLLERGLLSRSPVRNGIQKLFTIDIHRDVDALLMKSRNFDTSVDSRKLIISATLRVLGQPLGIGQGNNPTCQAARGMSMWSEHAPGKLLNMIATAAEFNNLEYVFEGFPLRSSNLALGLAKDIDLNLDPVSIVVVPHLDRIYNEMMKRASGRLEDPHRWVNPALYGQWIQTGFKSAIDFSNRSVPDYNSFARTFYQAFHPTYNGGHDMVYPNPVGIFITSATGDLLGFHAISIHRVQSDDKGQMRVFFVNPNNEGRQNWGQQISPKVFGHGEEPGESSLPFAEFLSRVYAFHYNGIVQENFEELEIPEIEKASKLAEESWGRSYSWVKTV